MCADIDKRTAALLIFVKEYAPGRNGSSADCESSCVIDFTEVTVFTALLEIKSIVSPT